MKEQEWEQVNANVKRRKRLELAKEENPPMEQPKKAPKKQKKVSKSNG